MKKILVSLLALVTMASCSKNDPHEVDNSKIVFGSSIEISSKAVTETSTQFENGDKIGIIGYKAGAAGTPTDFTSPFMNKVEFTYATTGSKFTSSPVTYWERGKFHHFYAYYPRTLTVVDGTASAAPTVALTVAAGTGVADDVMGAKIENTAAFDATNGNTSLLAFTHNLSKVKFAVKLADASVPASTVSAVSFAVDKNAGTYDITTGVVAASGSTATLTKTGLSQAATASAVTVKDGVNDVSWFVLPGNVISDVKVTINGQEISASNLTSNLTTEKGKITTITITIKANNIEFTSSIAPWEAATNNGGADAQ